MRHFPVRDRLGGIRYTAYRGRTCRADAAPAYDGRQGARIRRDGRRPSHRDGRDAARYGGTTDRGDAAATDRSAPDRPGRSSVQSYQARAIPAGWPKLSRDHACVAAFLALVRSARYWSTTDSAGRRVVNKHIWRASPWRTIA